MEVISELTLGQRPGLCNVWPVREMYNFEAHWYLMEIVT